MPVPRSFTSRQQLSQTPPRLPKEVILAVGARAIVRSRGEELGRVALAGEDGGATLADGVEVEITAWRPRRAAGALYQVRTTVGGQEGWVSASSLEAVSRPRERQLPKPPTSSVRTTPSSAKTPPRAPTPAR